MTSPKCPEVPEEEMARYLDVDNDMKRFQPIKKGFASKAIHAGQDPELWKSKAMVPPVHMSVAFKIDDMEAIKWGYSRVGNPTRQALEDCLACLDEARYSLTFASGLGAMATIVAMLHTGDHILACYDIYGSTYTLFTDSAKTHGIESDFIDFRDLNLVKNSIKPNTKVIWIESATNPLLRIFDIKKISELVHKIRKDIILVVDNTFLTSYFLKPLSLGADIVLYSLSKFMSGHSDLISGSLTMNDENLYKRLKCLQNSLGCVPSPYDCYLVQRSLKTLDVRMMKHFRNGLIVAKFLEQHPRIDKVIHPGLKSHLEHELAIQQFNGHSGMVAFYIKGADLKKSEEILGRLKMITIAAGLGDIESTITLPSIMSSWFLPPEDRERLEIFDNLVRLSVGLEDPEDLIEDLNQALFDP